ncbi:hypothetical protein KIPB_006071, partial [Kipferlia bialata]|eukprot:g6071.t1
MAGATRAPRVRAPRRELDEKTCALEGCDKRFRPKRKDKRCCCPNH